MYRAHALSKVVIMLACMAVLTGCVGMAPTSTGDTQPAARSADDNVVCSDATQRSNDELARIAQTECAFAKTMADRDFAAFALFLDDDAVFFNRRGALLGKAAVLREWQTYFEGPVPFSWAPTQVRWDRKSLAYTTGPVFDARGKCVARFNSIWRKQADGHWRIVFDKGDGKCDPTVLPAGVKPD